MRVCYNTKTGFKICIKLQKVHRIFKWISTYKIQYKHDQPLDLSNLKFCPGKITTNAHNIMLYLDQIQITINTFS